METLVAMNCKKTLLAMMLGSRGCYSLGLPALLRELRFPLSANVTPEANEKAVKSLMQDHCKTDKFQLVRRLDLLKTETTASYFGLLVDLCAPSLQYLTLGITTPEESEQHGCVGLDVARKLGSLKGLRLVVWREGSPRSYKHLLDFASELGTLEELMVWDKRELRPAGDTWLDIFAEYPTLPPKLVEIHGLTDEEVPHWANLKLKHVKTVGLMSGTALFENWREGKDPFPGVKKLVVDGEVQLGTSALWRNTPLREVNEVEFRNCLFNLTKRDGKMIAEVMGARKLKVLVKPVMPVKHVCSETMKRWMVEFTFWRKLGATILGKDGAVLTRPFGSHARKRIGQRKSDRGKGPGSRV